MENKSLRSFASHLAIAGALVVAFAMPAVASQKHHGHSSVHYANDAPRVGSEALVSDGPGSGFGFHRLPLPYHIAAVHERDRQDDAVHRAVIDDALTSGNYHSGFLGDSVYGAGNGAAYGVFNGADGYGSPYFAGYYGPGDGADYGVFGHAYSN